MDKYKVGDKVYIKIKVFNRSIYVYRKKFN